MAGFQQATILHIPILIGMYIIMEIHNAKSSVNLTTVKRCSSNWSSHIFLMHY